MSKKGIFQVGTSGWMYQQWKGDFYPSGIVSEKMLPYYAEHFSSVEVNNTFYQKPDKKKIDSWDKRVPSDFLFAIKANRYITHMKNLKEVEKPIDTLLATLGNLGEKLGPILFQLPPQWHVNVSRFKNFATLLPENLRVAVEFRHHSWYTQEILQILEEEKIGFCIHDHKDAPSPERITSDFIYLRFHGPEGYYRTKYKDLQIEMWAEKIESWIREGFDVYAYFNNDFSGYAVENAKNLKQKLENK